MLSRARFPQLSVQFSAQSEITAFAGKTYRHSTFSVFAEDCKMRGTAFSTSLNINIDYFIESATYGFLFTSCKTLENERVSAANE